jgi:hypothetical protein
MTERSYGFEHPEASGLVPDDPLSVLPADSVSSPMRDDAASTLKAAREIRGVDPRASIMARCPCAPRRLSLAGPELRA